MNSATCTQAIAFLKQSNGELIKHVRRAFIVQIDNLLSLTPSFFYPLEGRKSRLMSLKDLAKECSQGKFILFLLAQTNQLQSLLAHGNTLGAASLYILPESFVTKWRQWLKSPRTMARPAKVSFNVREISFN